MILAPVPDTDRIVAEGTTPHGSYRVEWRVDAKGRGRLVSQSFTGPNAPAPPPSRPPRPTGGGGCALRWVGVEWIGEPFPLYLLALPFRAAAWCLWPKPLRPRLRRRGCGCVKPLKDRWVRLRRGA